MSALLSVLLVVATAQAQPFAWSTATPQSQGLSAEKIEALRASLAQKKTRALLIIRNDRIVCEWYAPGHGAAKLHYTASMAKALVGGVSLAIAISAGRIALDDKVAMYVPAWKEDARKSRITIRHLGSHTSGLADAHEEGVAHDKLAGWKGDFWKRLNPPRDPFTISRDQAPVLFEPTEKMQYSNPGIAMLTFAVTASLKGTRHSDVRTLLRERVMRPIGVPDEEWAIGYGKTVTVDGLPLVASWGGGSYTARAVARVARLMLREGDWDGKRLLSREAVREVTRHAGLPGNAGMGWWSNNAGQYAKLPRDAYWGSGAGHQIVLVVPSLNLIVVRNGDLLAPAGSEPAKYHEPVRRHLFEPLIAAVTDRSTSTLPYPPSKVLSGAEWAPKETIIRRAKGSDNWPITWANDGHLYTAYGDGNGFDPMVPAKLSLGFARVEGGPVDFRGVNIRCPTLEQKGDGKSGKKCSGLLMVGGVLYLWARNAGNSQLAWSEDRGKTWTWAPWKFTTSFGCPTFLNFGKDFAGARDDYVYIYSPDSASAYEPADRMVLARVPKDRIRQRDDYEFFKGLNNRSEPRWTNDITERGAVFEHKGKCYRSGISYNAGLKRYLWCQTLPGGDARFKGGFGIYDAEQPWGPWTTVYYTQQWDVGPGETSSFPTKWMSDDGKTIHLVFSGDDHFCVRKLTLGVAKSVVTLPNTQPLTETGDLSKKMLDGLHRFAERKIEESVKSRAKLWKRDTSSASAYEKSIQTNRESFRKILGIVDPRVAVTMERFGDDDNPALVADAGKFRVYQVRWLVLDGVHGEGLLLEPKTKPLGHVVALPDADQTPEQIAGLAKGLNVQSQFARRLAENGFRVVAPVLVSRGFDFSGDPRIGMTNQPHREWIYRQAFHMGRHIIGYEVQKVQAAVDWLKKQGGSDVKIGVAGYGEGGLIALYAAAVDPRIDAALVSGYFGPRQEVWREPIYRNVWGLLHEFGDAEIASLIAPRSLVVEYCEGPRVDGPPPIRKGRRGGAAVGKLTTPALGAVLTEWKRLAALVPEPLQQRTLIHGENGTVPNPCGGPATKALAEILGVKSAMDLDQKAPADRRKAFDAAARQRRQVKELEGHVQLLVRGSDRTRNAYFLDRTTLMRTLASRGQRFRMFRIKEQPAEVFAREAEPFRKYLAREVIGQIDDLVLPARPRSRRVYDKLEWTGHEVMLDVYPDVFAWGVLLVPKGIKPGEKRPVVVCQHGRNGLPKDVIEGDHPAYHDFAARLAERGFVVFAPHNLYRGEDLYRMLNRKGNPLKLSMFSFITAQHRQILKWLGTLPFVDDKRIAFYGLSYGGETAVRVPPLLEGYCLSICSADFNDWARKVASTDSDYSFMYTIEWEMPYFNMGSTFNYAELAYLMVPRPFMVERGHHDGVAPDEWVASEYAKVRWLYAQLGLADRTEMEVFNGGHTINGRGTFDFLHRHLKWAKPRDKQE
jgi:CubicO group peptidase (beta-lactamase class C family)/dienelactone hydrolase